MGRCPHDHTTPASGVPDERHPEPWLRVLLLKPRVQPCSGLEQAVHTIGFLAGEHVVTVLRIGATAWAQFAVWAGLPS